MEYFFRENEKQEKKVIVNCISEIGEEDIPDELRQNTVYHFTDFGFIRKAIELTEQVVNGTLFLHAGRIESDNEISISERIEEIFRLIEAGHFPEAENNCFTFLSSYPDNASAYLGLLFCDMKVRKKEELANLSESFIKNKNYRKIILLDRELSAELQGYLDTINNRYLQGVYSRKYENALELYLNGQSNIKSIIKAKNAFELLNDYKDSRELSEKCSLIITELEKQQSLAKAEELIDRALRFPERAEELRQSHYSEIAFEDPDHAESLCKNMDGAEETINRCCEIRRTYLPL